jgi:hypothetical protein
MQWQAPRMIVIQRPDLPLSSWVAIILRGVLVAD